MAFLLDYEVRKGTHILRYMQYSLLDKASATVDLSPTLCLGITTNVTAHMSNQPFWRNSDRFSVCNL